MSFLTLYVFVLFFAILLFVKWEMKKSEKVRNKVVGALKGFSVIFFIPSWALITSGLILLFFYIKFIGRPNASAYESVSSSLRNNLANLNGEWSYHNQKAEEMWWLQICYSDKTRKGTYLLSQKNDSWGANKNRQVRIISEGAFDLVEGYDRYGDKAYVGKNTETGNAVFAVTQLENRYATDWLLRISLIEDDMFGEYMRKVKNECNLQFPNKSNNTISFEDISGEYYGESIMGNDVGTGQISINSSGRISVYYNHGELGNAKEFGNLVPLNNQTSNDLYFKFQKDAGGDYDIRVVKSPDEIAVILTGINWKVTATRSIKSNLTATQNRETNNQHDSLIDMPILSFFWGKWQRECGTAGYIQINKTNPVEIEVNSNQINIEATAIVNPSDSTEMDLYFKNISDLGVGGTSLHWDKFSKYKPIAKLKFSLSQKDNLGLIWYGFFNKNTGKYDWSIEADLIDGNGTEVSLIDCSK
jgi:hypothetical protein